MDFVPPTSHLIYIPAVAILGLVLGFIWGAKATRESFAIEAQRQEERAERAKRRAERHAQAASQPGPGNGGEKAPKSE